MAKENMAKTKCEGCGFYLEFDPKTQKLVCPHCSRSVEIFGVPFVKNKTEFTSTSAPIENKEFKNTFRCSACGANIETKHSKIVSVCPYCGSTNLETVEDSMKYIPDAIIPFKVDKNKAVACYAEWIKKRHFAPNNLKKFARMDTLQGKYIPSWVFDTHVFTEYSGVGVNTRRSNGKTYTSRYPFSGTKTTDYKNFYVNADPMRMPDIGFRKLGDFGFDANLKVFSTEYIMGFLTSNVSQDLQVSHLEAQKAMQSEIDQKIRSSKHYDRIEWYNSSHKFSDTKWMLAYLPVWVSKFVYRNKEYNFYVNGATGEVVGKSPKSFWKIFFVVLLVVAILAGIFYLEYNR